MNDKNFIEELRQKREEYGVTQTRLAVACGISREYYNRIEKGKQPLNDELREIIEKQIERFNPQEPLFLLIDYFRVRFPTTDALAIIRDVLQLKSNYMLYEDYGKYGYESKYVLGDINIMCSMQEHLGVLLELKGKGCRQMECYLLAQERSWYDFMLDCMTAGKITAVQKNAVAIYQRIQEKPYISVQQVANYICVLIRKIMSSMSRMAQKLKIRRLRTVLKYA